MGVIALLLGFSLVAAACGGDDKKSDGEATQTPGEADSAQPTPGGTLTFALEAETSGGFCLPEAQLAAGGITVANAIFEPIMILDENLDPKPYLAESVTSNPEATVYTIKLRPGIKFHDGSDLTAQVAKANIDVARNEPGAVAEYGRAPLLLPIILNNIASTELIDDLTYTITMKKPWAAFPTYLASGRFGIIGEAQLRSPKAECTDVLVGTGPFMLKPGNWQRNQQMVLDKNPTYWRKDANGVQLPYLDQLIFKPIESSVSRFQALEGGTVDAGQWGEEQVFEDIEAQSDKFNLIKEADGHREVGYGLINVSKPPFDNEEIREYMAMAIDRDAINDVSNLGKFDIANQPFDSEVMGYVEDLEGPVYDPEKAAEYFKGKNIKFSLSYATDPSTKAIAEDLARQLKDVGIEVTIDEKDQSTLINQALQGEFNTMLWRNHPGVDPDGQYLWWYSTNPTNFGRIKDPELDALLDEGRSSTDEAARTEIYQNVAKLFAEKKYNLWNWYSEWGIGATKDVHQIGYYTLPDGAPGSGLNWGWTYWSEVWVDQ